MNGLENQYGDRVAIQRINAGNQDGQMAFRAFRLQGHPALVLLTSEGEVFWTVIGEQSGKSLEGQLNALLEHP